MLQKIIIIGATSAMAEHCARLWVQSESKNIVLAGRNAEKIQRIAQDLMVRSPLSTIQVVTLDFQNPQSIQSWADEQVQQGNPDIVLIAHGSLPEQKTCEQDLALGAQAIMLNGVSPVLFAEAFANHMERAGHGTIAVLGSVAGDRGRKSNYIYGASKGFVTRYVQGLQHRLAKTKVKVVLIKPGPTDTPMTAQLKSQGSALAPVQDVAQAIVRAIKKGTPTVYTPAKWSLIMMIIRHLPRFIFNKMDI
jgi:short-subunit dehydrogenase